MRDAISLYATHCHDPFYRTVLFHENNPYSFQNRERCRLSNEREITKKVCKQELSFLNATHRHDLFFITVKCHDNIPKGI